MLRVALVGAGKLGQLHAKIIAANEKMELVYVCDANSDSAAQAAQRTGAVAASFDRVLNDKSVQGVVIASATNTHARFLKDAHKAGKTVFCEKPISLDFAEAAAVVSVLNEDGARCMVGFHRRYDPHFSQAKRQIADGSVGSVYQIIISSRSWAPPADDYIATSGGLFRDQSIHDFDMARYLLGEEVRSVYAVGACLIEDRVGRAGDVDTAMITLTSASGRQVHINNGRFTAFGYDQRIEIFGTKAALFVDNQRRHSGVRATQDGFAAAIPVYSFIERYREAYEAEFDAFGRFAQGEQVDVADQNDGLEAQRLAEAALESHRAGLPVAITVRAGDTSTKGIEIQKSVRAA